MKRKVPFYSIDIIWHMPLLLFLVVLYLCGMVVGSFTGLWSGGMTGAKSIVDSLLAGTVQTVPALQRMAGAMCSTALWMFLCLVSGLCTPSILFCSAVVAIRGFFLAFSITSIVHIMGLKGIAVSFVMIGSSAIVSIPCLLLMAAAVLETSRSLPIGQKRRYFYELGKFRGPIVICATLSLIAAGIRAGMQPTLLQWFGF